MIRIFVLILAFALLPLKASAITLLRDAEIERGLMILSQPILQTAGLNSKRMKIYVVDDARLNAFVIDGSAIFLNAGLIMRVKTVQSLQAVIAHEAAHIANGHLSRRAANFQTSRTAAGLGAALAVIAGAAAGDLGAGAGAALGAIGSAQRSFLSHTRAEESSADQSGVRFMAEAGIDPQGAVDVLELFSGQDALSASRRDPYALTHPLTRNRLRAMKGFVAAQNKDFTPSSTHQAWFALIQGKINAFERAPNWTLTRTKGKTDQVSLMRRAVAYERKGDLEKSRKAMADLLKKAPRNPYVHELNGQLLFENRNYAASIKAYEKALQLAPNTPLILAGYGRALLARGTESSARQALKVLATSHGRDPLNPGALRDLANAYAKVGQNGMAALVTAERYALLGRSKDAAILAKRAVSLLPKGSAGWQRADDVLRTTQRARR
ncbi:MAG: M48 family metalloprotease [Pseudomonadota bacterium]